MKYLMKILFMIINPFKFVVQNPKNQNSIVSTCCFHFIYFKLLNFEQKKRSKLNVPNKIVLNLKIEKINFKNNLYKFNRNQM